MKLGRNDCPTVMGVINSRVDDFIIRLGSNIVQYCSIGRRLPSVATQLSHSTLRKPQGKPTTLNKNCISTKRNPYVAEYRNKNIHSKSKVKIQNGSYATYL